MDQRSDCHIRGILFDLDGTLIDSIPDIALAANLTLETLGLPQVDIDRLRTWVGNGADTLVKRALTGEFDGQPDPELFEQAHKTYQRTTKTNRTTGLL